jgi:N-acyl-D-aspartate/D-glutamate deacylase/CubicO group peptidase (beta-lactamase class C family)
MLKEFFKGGRMKESSLACYCCTLFCLLFTLGVQSQTKLNTIKLDSALTALHQLQLFNGVALVAQDGQVVYKKAFGNANAGGKTALNTQSSFNLASVSKQFVGMCAMMLKEENKLQYDDPVQKHLAGFPYPNITVRHLLNHTSGLPEYFDLSQRYQTLLDTLTNDDMLQLLIQHKPELEFEPGSKWAYCNTGYVLLASVVTKASGKPFADFFAERIARPLGMDHSFVYHFKGPKVPDQRVLGMRREGGKLLPDDLLRLDGVVGDGNVYCSAEDLLRWDQALYTEKLIKQATLKEAFTPVKLKDGSTYPYGFGWGIDKEGKLLSHTGGWVGFRTIIIRDLEQKRTFILLDNSGQSYGHQLIQDWAEGIAFHLPKSQLIRNVLIIDGTGSAARPGAVRVLDNHIQDIGTLAPLPGEKVVDGGGKVLAPGFIDTHSHHVGDMDEKPEMLAVVSQGITTIVTGQDGSSEPMDTLATWLKRKPVAVNIASYTGHSTVRIQAMGLSSFRRPATAAEVEKMKVLLDAELKAGSLGLCSGLEYEQGFYSNRDEVISLAKVAAAAGGRYMSHIRSEDIHLDEALDEIIQIGREAKLPVQISHFKIALKSRWGQAPQILAQLEAARTEGIDITADVYPYEHWLSTPRVLFPNKDFTNLASAEFAVTQLIDPTRSIISRYGAQPSYVGKTLSAIAQMRGKPVAETLIYLIAEASRADKGASIMGASMADEDISNLLRWSHTNVCTDGFDGSHPRGHGAFTRVLAKYVREKKALGLEEAIHKMTGLSAQHLGIRNRGLIAPGYYADLVLFDPKTVQDNATFQNPSLLSTGIEQVWVNGKTVFTKGKSTKAFPGILLKRDTTKYTNPLN